MNRQQGYTLLFAIIITTIVLAVGVSILTIARKEVLLSSGARESQIAIYMADNGLECAAYWEANNYFATSSPPITSVKCDGQDHVVTLDNSVPNVWARNFLIVSRSDSRCAEVSVIKERASNGVVQTSFVSKGYNVGGKVTSGIESCNQPSLNRVERAIRFTYQ